MKTLLAAGVTAASLLLITTAEAQTRNTATSRFRMAQAYCTTGPCDPWFTFQGGATLIKRAKQPKLVSNRKLGNIRINALQRLGGPAIPTSLDAQMSGTTFYGQDQNAVCPLANTVVSGPFATSTMSCTVGAAGDANCKGNLFFIDFTPAECSDVAQSIQDLQIEVYEHGFVGVPERKIATAGINILGKTPDCASGGAGCP
ncbi:MAG TPA: hypothetical protein VL049_30470 [Candidatus Dormibacteraeota bacterium]|nr:hypothetical protein [Candidatus Dormibacteraeota bacterium]